MEVPSAWGKAADHQRGTRPDPTDEPREPAVGRHQDPGIVPVDVELAGAALLALSR
jgi:hypothetical protein